MPRRAFANPMPAWRAAFFAVLAAVPGAPAAPVMAAERAVTIGDTTIVDQGLAAVGRLPASLRDKFGETFGSGSGMAVDAASWSRGPEGVSGTVYLLPDRGYNVAGTTDYRPRINKIMLRLRPAENSSAAPEARRHSLDVTLLDSILLSDGEGEPLTGLDPQAGGVRAAGGGFPVLPQAANGRIALDAEGIVRLADGSFFISDEYGPYIYRFAADGRMLSAIRPPDAFIPRRDGKDHFSSNNPAAGAPKPSPVQPQTGRQNNQGFEGLSLTPDGRFLAVILQSATRQDGGDAPETRDNTRILIYDVADPAAAKLVREHVVPLPRFTTADGKVRVAAQSELLALDSNRFLLLCRDSDNGYGLKGATSRFRRIMLLDLADATNIAGSDYDGLTPVAPKGVLELGVVPARLVSFIDLNDNAVLGRFGLHNGEPNDAANLTEKWEAMGVVRGIDPGRPRDAFLLVANDNDFITQNGFQVGAPYRDDSGVDADTMFLAYRLTLPH